MEHPHRSILQGEPRGAQVRGPLPRIERPRLLPQSGRRPVAPRPQHDLVAPARRVLGGGEHHPAFLQLEARRRAPLQSQRPLALDLGEQLPRGGRQRSFRSPPPLRIEHHPQELRPERAVHEGHLPAHQLGAQHLGRILQGGRDRVDEPAMRVRPPAPPHRARDLAHQRPRAARRGQRQDAFATKQLQRVLCRSQQGSDCRRSGGEAHRLAPRAGAVYLRRLRGASMKIHEYQAKEILRRFGVAVPRGKLATTADEAVAAARELMAGKPVCVVKAQIHAGGRGKGGGVKLAKSPEQAGELARAMLGMQLVTHQTGPQGHRVSKVYVEEGMDIARELYLGLTLDRGISRDVLMASSEGGVEIEEVAASHPEKILREAADPVVGLAGYQARNLAFGLGLSGAAVSSFVKFATAMYRAYQETDASIVEINPLVVTKQGEVVALDAKVNFDDNALFRHPDVAALRDPDEEDPREG